jgi:ComF family protein
VVIPVPLARARLRQRGFNQARLLADHVAPALGACLLDDALEREERAAQSTLRAANRLANLDGAFRCPTPPDIRGRRVLLVDDVVTTGATVSACADTLAQAGASRINVLAFARDL